MPTSTYSAATIQVSSRAAGSRSTARMAADAASPSARPTRGLPGPSPIVQSADSTAPSPMATSTPPGSHHRASDPLTRGPRKVAAASTEPDPALPAVSSLVVSETSGSRALWTGRVNVMATAPTAPNTHTTANGASSSTTTPAAIVVTAWARYPSRSALGVGIPPSQVAATDARRADGTSMTTAIRLAPRTPCAAYAHTSSAIQLAHSLMLKSRYAVSARRSRPFCQHRRSASPRPPIPRAPPSGPGASGEPSGAGLASP